MVAVKFYNDIEDSLLKYAVIVSKSRGKWVLCKHRERNTYECPGGHREYGEDILTTAKRELYEETGATDYVIKQICVYSVYGYDGVIENNVETFGMLYYADINEFEKLPDFEIEKVELFEELPDNWTYPEIQPKLLEKVNKIIASNAEHNEMQI
jgi:8-oxo-dGTP diphosphatase